MGEVAANATLWIDGPRIYPMFGLNERTIREAANEGRIERRYVGRKPLYSAASINAWIAAQPEERSA